MQIFKESKGELQKIKPKKKAILEPKRWSKNLEDGTKWIRHNYSLLEQIQRVLEGGDGEKCQRRKSLDNIIKLLSRIGLEDWQSE